MKTCPACHRPVADDARICPHADCAKPLSAGAWSGSPPPGPLPKGEGSALGGPSSPPRRPPPPGKVHLSPADLPRAGRAGGGSRKRALQTAILVCLAALFCGGVYYAAIVDRRPAGPVAAAPGGADAAGAKPARRSSPDPETEQPRSTKSAGRKPDGPSATRKTDAAKAQGDKPSLQPGPPQPGSPQAESNDKTVAAKDGPPEDLGLYSQRTAPRREEWIAGLGGTPESEKMVAAGHDWLARHQAADGHWGPDCLGASPGSQCDKDHPCSGPGGRYEAALTGLAVLAFQAGGHYDFNEHPYSDRVARALDCLVDQQGFNGELVGSMNNASEGPDLSKARFDHCYMYEHGIAAFALAEACAVAKASGHAPRPKILKAAGKAVRFIESQQHHDGGWRYTPQLAAPSDTSVSGWSMLAL